MVPVINRDRSVRVVGLMLCWLLATLLATPLHAAVANSEVKAVQTLIQAGNPEQAVKEARRVLVGGRITNTVRFHLLQLISDAEFIRASARFFSDIDAAAAAQKAVLKEFPQRSDSARLRWRLVKLYWRHGQNGAALANTQTLRRIDPRSTQAHLSWMVDAQIKLKMGRYSQARRALLRFSLGASTAKEQAQLLAWTAMVDEKEQRYPQAMGNFKHSFKRFPGVIEGDPLLYSHFILMEHRQGDDHTALMLSDRFLTRYIDSDLIPTVRLMRMGILARQPDKHAQEVERGYTFLSEHAPGSTIGKQAFMRKMMFQVRDKNDFFSLKPVLVALKKLASQNQMSVIEDEAMLDQGLLWARISNSGAKGVSTNTIDAALEQLSRVDLSSSPALRQQALDHGSSIFSKYIKKMLDKKQLLKAVALWKRYPDLRTRTKEVLRFDIANAMRLLTQFGQAETLLNALYARNKTTLRGQQVMLELARVWLDRGDAKGIDKINHWLSEHEFTIYHPEFLLLVAQMQLNAKRFDAAAQTILHVAPEDLVHALLPEYWKSRAHIAEARHRWHVAAHAWQEFGNSDKKNRQVGLRRQALALYKAGDYANAESKWQQLPKAAHDAAWRYYLNMSRYHNGEWSAAVKALRELAQDTTAGIYATLADMALAEHDARQLLNQNP
ncbi:MAG: tetratricopeptide repeat protein [Mariprofundales bacterium]|nr:tetratricopeptide repeat protein [Mariprofundales bacterium]